jgi:hypothetical protein
MRYRPVAVLGAPEDYDAFGLASAGGAAARRIPYQSEQICNEHSVRKKGLGMPKGALPSPILRMVTTAASSWRTLLFGSLARQPMYSRSPAAVPTTPFYSLGQVAMKLPGLNRLADYWASMAARAVRIGSSFHASKR